MARLLRLETYHQLKESKMRTKSNFIGLLLASIFSTSASASIIGSWHASIPGGNAVFTFFDNGYYHHGEEGDPMLGPGGTDGMEWGTYNYDGSTLSTTTSLDTNGEWGFSHTTFGTVTVTGDTLSLDGVVDLERVNSSSIVGGWVLGGESDTSEAVSITFLDNGDFMLMHGNSTDTCNCGQAGIEFGSYTWNETTSDVDFTILSDTTGEFGVSNTDSWSIMVNGNQLTLADSLNEHEFSRVGVSAVPIPAAAWLFGSGLLGLGFIKRRRS